MLNTNDKDHCMLKPRELNFTGLLMRHSFDDVSLVSRYLVETFVVILSSLLYGGLHAILLWARLFGIDISLLYFASVYLCQLKYFEIWRS